MEVKELSTKWVEHFNRYYYEYYTEEKEPRYHLKQFFLYSYYLFRSLGSEYLSYLNSLSELFRRDPANDYYGYRDPTDEKKGKENSIEWTVMFEIAKLVGFPYNNSAKEKMLINAHLGLDKAEETPMENFHDIMLCSAVASFPDKFNEISEWLPSYISENVQNPDITPHQIVAYLNALKEIPDHHDLMNSLVERLIAWIESPSDGPRRQILIWARLITRLDWCQEIFSPMIQNKCKHNLLQCLKNIRQVDWPNIPIILEATFKATSEEEKESIKSEIERRITPSKFYQFLEVFPFIKKDMEASEVEEEILKIKEKCQPHPTQELCKQCMVTPIGTCWVRVLAKITRVHPWTHGGFEVADIVVYSLDKGIYFVIKANPILNQREGDVLFRQCVKLFSNDHALVFYLNPHETAPWVIENTRNAAKISKTSPRFEVIEKKYIRQIFSHYKKIN